MLLNIVTIGNALVDVIARVSPTTLADLGLTPGGMTLVDDATSKRVYDTLTETQEVSGGSAANTAAVAAKLGGMVTYVGKVSDDALGAAFSADLNALRIKAPAPRAIGTTRTGNCLSLITPEGQRTMCTHLGAAATLTADDVTHANISMADIVFLEGYLLDAPNGYDIFDEVIAARPNTLALTLSDPGCVARHITYLTAITPHIDVIFGNEAEMMALTGESTPQEAAEQAGEMYHIAICTHGAKGVYVCFEGVMTHLPAVKTEVVDTTGAGDSLAGTVLWALAQGYGPVKSVEMGIRVASDVISQIGARPSHNIKDLLQRSGLLSETDYRIQ